MSELYSASSPIYRIAGMGIKEDMSENEKQSILLNNILSQSDGVVGLLLSLILWFIAGYNIGIAVFSFLSLMKTLVSLISMIGKPLEAKVFNIYGLSLIGGSILFAGINASNSFISINIYFIVVITYAVLSFNWKNQQEKWWSMIACICCLIGMLIFPWIDQAITFSDSKLAIDHTLFVFSIPLFGGFLSFIGYYLLKNTNDEVQEELKESITTTEAHRQKLFDSEQKLRQNVQELEITQQQLISEKQKAEEALAALQSAHEQLVQSEKMSSLGQLTAGVAHEINNPVNFISVGTQTLKAIVNDLFDFFDHYNTLKQGLTEKDRNKIWNAIDAKQQELGGKEELKEDAMILLKDIEQGVDRVVEIVNGLRNFSRSDTSAMVEADLHEIFDSSLVVLNSKLKGRCEVVKSYDRTLPPIQCFAGQLSQVFVNIISNAVDAMPNKGTLSIRTENLAKTVEIKIADDGVGMPKEVQQRIFDPFFTTKAVGKGTGLGLSISHGIIEKHQGTLTVQSAEGEGTIFTIRIPKIE